MMLEPDNRLPSPPPKRRRTKDAGNSVHEQSGNPFWFPDGYLVLRLNNHMFKVHHRRLQASDIFADMLTLPQPSNPECVDGSPCVELTESAADWMVALRWMYDAE